jgi:hypothetical protein
MFKRQSEEPEGQVASEELLLANFSTVGKLGLAALIVSSISAPELTEFAPLRTGG